MSRPVAGDDPLYEALVPQADCLQAWSFPARSMKQAARIAAGWLRKRIQPEALVPT